MRIDILIPTYQRADSLMQNLQHILCRLRVEQVEEHYRILVSDNASTDGTQERVLALIDDTNLQQERIAYYRNMENIGLEGNAVRVASLATSEFILWCGDDDFLADGYLRFLVESIAASPRLGCVIPGLAALHRDGSLERGRLEEFDVREFSAGYASVHAVSHLAHQMSGLLLKREQLLEEYLAQPEFRNPYLFIYFAANRLLSYDGIYAPKFATLITVFNEKAWAYNGIGLLDEVFKNYLALRRACGLPQVEELMLRFVLMHSYRLAFRPLRPRVLLNQLFALWKTGSQTLSFKGKMGLLFLREIASGAVH